MAPRKKKAAAPTLLPFDEAEAKDLLTSSGGLDYNRLQLGEGGFTLKYAGGGEDMIAELECAILWSGPFKRWWEKSYGAAENSAPTCVSFDGVLGTTQGPCASCEARWWKGREGNYCKTGGALWVLPAGMTEPVFVWLSWRGNRAYNLYLGTLIKEKVHSGSVRTVLTTKTKQEGILFANRGPIPQKDLGLVVELIEQFKADPEAAQVMLLPEGHAMPDPKALPEGKAPKRLAQGGNRWKTA